MKSFPVKNTIAYPSILLSLLFLTACSDNKATLSSLWDDKFSSCGTVCHSSGADDGTDLGPDLSSKTKFYDNLYNKSVSANYPGWAAQKTGDCDTQKFIAPGKANESTLAAGLIQSVSDSMKASMLCDSSYNVHVANNVTLSKDTADAMVDWINEGAQNN